MLALKITAGRRLQTQCVINQAEFKGVLILGTINSYHRVTLRCELPEGSWLAADGHKAEVLDDDKFHEEYEVS